jgi:hypothetical protein
MADKEASTSAIRPEGRPQAVQRDVSKPADAKLDNETEVPAWERDDAPPGSTASSSIVKGKDGKDRVQGPTHYAHTADGRIVGSYGGGTHYTDADVNDGEPVAIIAHY